MPTTSAGTSHSKSPPTRGEEMLAEIDAAERSLVELEATAYTSEAVRKVIQDLGSKVERFLKKTVSPGLDAGVDFARAINRLKAIGLSKEHRQKFHALRD